MKLQNIGFPNNAGLVIHVLYHWKILEGIYSQDVQKNIDHVHKDVNNILSTIIILVTDLHGGKTVLKME